MAWAAGPMLRDLRANRILDRLKRRVSRGAPPGRDVILTGLPRSGTTLACFLLNKLDNTVALHEPLDLRSLLGRSPHEAVCARVATAFSDMRKSILTQGIAISRHVDGVIAANHVPDEVVTSGLREDRASKGPIEIGKPLDHDFLLVIKHPVPFTALIESLNARFPCYAIIRNPVSVLGSWNSVAMSFRDGHAPNAEGLEDALRTALASIEDRIERQIHLLAWFYEKYERVLPRSRIIRYEDLVASGGKALTAITPAAVELGGPLVSRNRSAVYGADMLRRLATTLLERDGAFWSFYSREEVKALVEATD
jgi:hypothetical protein